MVNGPDKRHTARWMPLLLGTGIAALVVAAAMLFLSARAQEHDRSYRRHVTELSVLAAALPTQAAAAGRGEEAAFDRLKVSHARLKLILAEIEAGSAAFDALSSTSARKLGGERGWLAVLEGTEQVLAGRAAAAELRTWASESREGLLKVMAATGDAVGAPGGAVALRALPRFESVGQRTADDLQLLANGSGESAVLARRLSENSSLLTQFLAGLAGEESGAGVPRLGGEAASRLAQARDAYADFERQLRGTLQRAGTMATAQRAGAALGRTGDELYGSLTRQSAEDSGSSWIASPWPTLAAVLVALLCLAGAAWLWTSAANLHRAVEADGVRNRRNQDAILRLLDEMSSLADGDLTVQATVTDDITGAIADSINYAIEALRDLVSTINATAVQLDSAARQTQAAAGHLAKASVAQSRQVAAATDAVGAMATSIEEVSGNAERSADVARHAVDVAHKGGDAVRRTIDGMNTIRETIQDTSKRIKRLGESSQEIGNIVELINDIAEQTNILALNASIQASMAGESGRGFAVVADEVQRLAERAGHATRQIEVLVRTIQTDTNEAVVSMERTTTDVVGGALLAENAGAALGEIEDVSNQIASLVQNISASARQQAATSAHISRTMQVLREISQQSADNTSATSSAIGRLADLSAELRQSAAGFRLPVELPASNRRGTRTATPAATPLPRAGTAG